MLYLISGASRSGKTLLAEKILAQKGISYLSLDWLVMGFTNGIPEYGIHDKLMPDEIAERSWRFLKAMIESMISCDIDHVIEGEALLPELVVELAIKYPDQLKICFVGYADVTVDQKFKDIKKFPRGQADWLQDKSDDYILDHVKNMIRHSRNIKKSCKENKIKYLDTSENFLGALEDTIAYLFA
jgi:hypothetical protein